MLEMSQLDEIPNVGLVRPLEDNGRSFLGCILFEMVISHTHALDMGLVLELTVFKLGLLTQVQLL